MFARLSQYSGRKEGFQGASVTQTPQQMLNTNSANYASVIPNMVIATTQNNYSYPNTGYQNQQQQSSNAQLQGALANIGSVENIGISGRTAPVPYIGGVLTGVSDPIGANLAHCRTFQGLGGLSNLQASQPGIPVGNACGWRYQSGTGPIPQVAQGAFGNESGPLDTANPRTDAVGNGVSYFRDLKSAEKQMVTDICKVATTCQDMSQVPVSAVGDFKNVCGYCKTSRKIIPISMTGGRAQPRYTDVDKQCASADIITVANAAQCPAPPPGQPQPTYWKCFNSPLDRDCVGFTAQIAGCSPNGTMVAALNAGTNPTDFADQLRQKKSFQAYQSLANPAISEDIIRQGNGTLFSAFMNFYMVNQKQYDTNEKLSVAARDLCRQPGLFDTYNFCADLTDSSREIGLNCMQQEFLRQGGTTQGTSYPNNLSALKGMNWGAYKASIVTLVTDSRSADPTRQRNALNQLTGLGLQRVPTGLSLGDGNQGCEVFWFDRLQGGVCMGRRPVLSATGSNIPFINVGGGEVDGTGLSEMVEFVSFCDLRPSINRNLMFGVVTDDGFQMAINQDVFTIKNQSMAFGAYYDQGPTWHQSRCFPITADSQGVPNIVTFTWFESGGGATFTPYFYDCARGQGWRNPAVNGNVDPDWQSMCYFTQEVAAPSLSFQVYTRRGVSQFCEKRLWSRKLTAQPAPRAEYIAIRDNSLPSDLMAMAISNQLWKTAQGVAFSGFQAVTVCFNITAQNVAGNGLNWMFLWGQNYGYAICCDNGPNNSFNLYLKTWGGRGQQNTSQVYNVPQGTWCIATINQIPATFGKSITGVQFFVQTCANLSAGKILPSNGLSSFSPGGTLMNEYKSDKSAYGSMYLGGTNGRPTQMTMQVAWIHCFDNKLSTTDPAFWKKEVQGSWQGRWFE